MMGGGAEFSLVMVVFPIILLPLTGVFLAATPYLMRRGECFAVTVPDAAAHDPFLRGLKRRYALVMLGLTAVITVITGLLAAFGHAEAAVLVALIAGTLLLCAAGYGLMLFYRRKVQVYKAAQQWTADVQEASVVVGEAPVPCAVSLKWNLLYFPLMLITLAIGVVGYAHMPEQIPQQVNFQGEVSNWMDKSPLVVLFPVLTQAFMAGCFVFSRWSIARSKRPTDPGAPATSALAYGMFARAQSIMLVVSGLMLCLVLGPLMELSFVGVISLGQAGAAVVVLVLVVTVSALAVSAVYGQAGSRVFKRLQASDQLLADKDAHWKLGIFYVNPNDASLFLPERFGIGWTLNFARPAAWALMIGGLLATVVFMVVVFAIAGD